MVIQYPHILKFDIVTGGSEEIDENGDTVIVPGATTNVEIKCRFEVNGSGEQIPSNDGLKLDYGWIVYMPLGNSDIPEGVEIEGYHNEALIASGTVKRFFEGTMNTRAWV
jgi:hypothetical protein